MNYKDYDSALEKYTDTLGLTILSILQSVVWVKNWRNDVAI